MNPLIYFNTCRITNCFLEVSLFILSFSFQVLSLLPPIIIKLLEWVGFSGDRVHFLNFVMLYVFFKFCYALCFVMFLEHVITNHTKRYL